MNENPYEASATVDNEESKLNHKIGRLENASLGLEIFVHLLPLILPLLLILYFTETAFLKSVEHYSALLIVPAVLLLGLYCFISIRLTRLRRRKRQLKNSTLLEIGIPK